MSLMSLLEESWPCNFGFSDPCVQMEWYNWTSTQELISIVSYLPLFMICDYKVHFFLD